MHERMVARVTCPACAQPFQTAVQQIFDVREDPAVKGAVINGVINIAQCPHCGVQGAMGVPFLYHDPDKELALMFMPMQIGSDQVQREQLIGRLTRRVMDKLPAEERKAYLLQPEVFLTLENLTKRILFAEGVTEEMLEEQKQKAQLLQRMADATSEEALEAMITANDEIIDDVFFLLLTRNLELAQSAGYEEDAKTLRRVREKTLALSTVGQAIKARNEMLGALRDEPNRDKLLELLIKAEEKATREMLVTFGRPLLDYLFFQSLTSKIDAATSEDDKQHLTALRSEVLDIRDQLDKEAQALLETRATLLRDLLTSDDPKELARRRIMEIDDAFLNVLGANLEEARRAGNQEAVERVREIWDVVLDLMVEAMPPEVRFFNGLLAAEDEAEIDRLLEANKPLVTERMAEFVEKTEAEARGEGDTETADQMVLILKKLRRMITEEMLA